jgi:uncharacterized protein (DUF3084 family)
MTEDRIVLILIAILGCAWIADLVKGWFQRRKVQADSEVSEAKATQVLIAGANLLVTPLTNRLREAEDEATLLRRELQGVRQELAATMTELHEARNELIAERAENKKVTTENRKLRALIANGPIH